ARVPQDPRDRSRVVVRPGEPLRELGGDPARHEGGPERAHARASLLEEPQEPHPHAEGEGGGLDGEHQRQPVSLRHRPRPSPSSSPGSPAVPRHSSCSPSVYVPLRGASSYLGNPSTCDQRRSTSRETVNVRSLPSRDTTTRPWRASSSRRFRTIRREAVPRRSFTASVTWETFRSPRSRRTATMWREISSFTSGTA